MEKRYTGNAEELNRAKSKGMSSKIRRFLATALIGGNLMAVGQQTDAKAYTTEQLSVHQKHVEEVKSHYDNIFAKSESLLKNSLAQGEISEDTYVTAFDGLKKLTDNGRLSAHNLQEKHTNILDKHLVFMKTLPTQEGDTKTRIQLNVNDVSSLNKNQIEILEKKYHIDSIVMNRYYDMDYYNLSGYTVNKYKQILTQINDKFRDLKDNKNLTDLEKTTIVLKRMANITYDYSALSEPTKSSNSEMQNNSKSKAWTSRTMEDPLFNNSGICAGYTDLFKNVMSYLNIEAKEIRGYVKGAETANTFPGEANHSWNQVKIDGKWYNLDITVFNTVAPDSLQSNMPHPYLFVSDQEFNESRSSNKPTNYQPLLGLHEEANHSISAEEIDKALITAINYEKNLNKTKNSFFAKTSKRLNNLKNKIIGHENTQRVNSKTSSSDQANNQNNRKEFLSSLSSNGEYQSGSNIQSQENSSAKNSSLEKNDFERS